MGFFLNRILRKQHGERKQGRRKEKTQRYCCSHNNSHFDRLPDDILVHILSFMSTRDCVRSSTLGKRWRLLWTLVPNLKFDSRDHKSLTSFSNFFNRFVFAHKGQNINTFRSEQIYHAQTKNNEYMIEMETLIPTAIACNVQIIDIHSCFELVLPHCLFICKTLVDLTLSNVAMDCPMTGTSVYLPALKKLELRMVWYESEDSLVHLLSGCPMLEELTILKDNDVVVCLNISSPTLTRLHLEIDRIDSEDEDEDFEVILDTPALEYLGFHDSLSWDFSAGMLASLTEADVFLANNPYWLDVHPHRVLEFVGKLNHVKCLKLTIDWMEVDDSTFSAWTIEYRNLTELDLAGDDCRFVTYFLENSDNLEFLTVTKFDDFQNWMEPKQVPVCLIYHLGNVRFDDFACLETKFNMVEYILRNAKVLKRMEICFSNSQEKKNSEARKRISLFERASEACQLVFI